MQAIPWVMTAWNRQAHGLSLLLPRQLTRIFCRVVPALVLAAGTANNTTEPALVKPKRSNAQIPMEKVYDPSNLEKRNYQQWLESGYFTGHMLPHRQNFSIALPPPNVTGTLHMGHAFQQTIMDVMTRYHRMLGHNTLWQVGTDHAGIATQMVVERKIANEEGKTRHDYGREAFIDKIWEWKQFSAGTMQKQMMQLGASGDWDREAFTMDPERCKAVQKVFVDLYDQGYIYRGKRLVNWDPKLRTAISDLEVENRDVTGSMWDLRYVLEDGVTTKEYTVKDAEGNPVLVDGQPVVKPASQFLVVSTTRPETIFGDTAVAVHPEDERYQHLIGKKVYIPVVDRWVPVVADEYVERDFGTGVVKITPAHDFNDYEVGKRHSLPMINIMDPEANLLATTPVLDTNGRETGETYSLPEGFANLERFAARKAIVAKYEELGYLEGIKPHDLKVPYGDRGGVVIEPYLTDQWYVDVKDMAKTSLEVVADGRIKFVPEQYTNMYNNWLNDIQDWCISRQLWWGHRIPAYYDSEGNVYVGHSEADVRTKYNLAPEVSLEQDPDVLDTWFSSALWTFSTLGWPEPTEHFKHFHPTSVLVTGFDIIFFWVARMIMMTTHFCRNEDGSVQVPFKTVYVTGLILDEEGNKMSKSKGNVLDPLDMMFGIGVDELVAKRTANMMQPQLAQKIEKRTRKHFPNGIAPHGADALRYTLCASASFGRGIVWDMKRLEGYRNFCNKLWNAARFIFMNLEGDEGKFKLADLAQYRQHFSAADQAIESSLETLLEKVETALETYRFDILANVVYDFVWNEFCNWYLEFAKVSLASDNKQAKAATKFQLLRVFEVLLRVMHPIMPFITEEIWQNLKTYVTDLDGLLIGQEFPLAANSKWREGDGKVAPDYLQQAGKGQVKVTYRDKFVTNADAVAQIEQVKQLVTLARELRAEYNLAPSKAFNCTLVSAQGAQEPDFAFLQNPANAELVKTLAKLASLEVSTSESQDLVVTKLLGAHKVEFPLAEVVDLAKETARLEKEVARLDNEIALVDKKLANENFVSRAPAEVIAKEQQKRADAQAQKAQVVAQLAKLATLKARS